MRKVHARTISAILKKIRGPLGMSEGVVVETHLVNGRHGIRARLKKVISKKEKVCFRHYEDGKSIVWFKFKT